MRYFVGYGRIGKNGGSGMTGNAGAPRSLASGFKFTAGACSSAPMTAIGHDRRAGLEREPHEAVAELLQLVALRERLGDALGALGEDEDRLFVLEQAAAVLGRADDLAPAREQVRRERQRLHVALDHGAHDARRIVLEEHGAADADGVERQLARVVARRAARGPLGMFSTPCASTRK